MSPTEVDERIKKDVQPFLYNEGEGKLIPIVDLVKFRNKDRHKSGIKASKNKQKSAQDQARIDSIMMMENNQIDGILSKQGNQQILFNSDNMVIRYLTFCPTRLPER